MEGRGPRAISPSVSAAPKAQFILSACKAVEGRCHLPIASRQGGLCYPTRVQVTVRQNTDTQPFIVSLLPFTRRWAL